MSDVSCTGKNKSVCLGIVFFFVLIFGILLGIYINRSYWKLKVSKSRGEEVRSLNSSYQYINPLLECAVADDYIGSNEGKPSKEKLKRLIERLKENGMVSEVSIYFRNLNDGPWVGINEKTTFAPASLLKVPIMMSLLRANDLDTGFLAQTTKVDFSSISTVIPHFANGYSLEKDKDYSYKELMDAMIIHSNNDAAYTLLNRVVTQDRFDVVFKDLNIERVKDAYDEYITVRDYAAFFRILFNASYLSRTSSEEALRILSQSTFKKGLVAGLPPGTVVAHKYGERQVGNIKQLHDCGVVYVSNQPYLLCVMTRGEDIEKLASVISTISKQVYEDVIMSLK